MGRKLDPHHGANPTIEHPRRNLKAALQDRSADTAAVNVRTCPLDGLMNVNMPAGPWMPLVENLANIGPVGVLSPRCTTPSGRTARLAIGLRPRKRRHRHGCPPVPLRSTCGQPWRRKQSCTNNQRGPLSGGRSRLQLRASLDTYAYPGRCGGAGHKSVSCTADRSEPDLYTRTHFARTFVDDVSPKRSWRNLLGHRCIGKILREYPESKVVIRTGPTDLSRDELIGILPEGIQKVVIDRT